ncbi:MAG: hypothetical protein AAB459_01580 [Patescibacteria group bacterium]
MQKVATKIFMIASIVFGVLGVSNVIFQIKEDSLPFQLLIATVFVILPSFAISVAGKYLKEKK